MDWGVSFLQNMNYGLWVIYLWTLIPPCGHAIVSSLVVLKLSYFTLPTHLQICTTSMTSQGVMNPNLQISTDWARTIMTAPPTLHDIRFSLSFVHKIK